MRESHQLGHPAVGTEHLLLALLAEKDGMGAQVLRGMGADYGVASGALMGLLGEEGEEEPDSPSARSRWASVLQRETADRASWPVCPRCGAELAGGAVMYRTIATSAPPSEEIRDIMIAYCAGCGRAIGVLPG